MRSLIVAIYVTIYLFAYAAQANTCTPAPSPHYCSTAAPSHTNTSNWLFPNSALNPVDLYTGDKFLQEVDYYGHPQAPDLRLIRYYHSQRPHLSALGTQWHLHFNAQFDPKTSRITFSDGQQRSLPPTDIQTQPPFIIWHASNEESWWFHQSSGWLAQIHFSQRPPLIIHRHTQPELTHQIQSVEQNQHQLHFIYDTNQIPVRLQAVQTPVGEIHYHYQTTSQQQLPFLAHVTYPDQRRLLYHAEPDYQQGNPWAITGKSIQQHWQQPPKRVRSWVYDQKGRVIFSMGTQAHEWVRTYYPDTQFPDQTRLQGPQGLTHVRFDLRLTPPRIVEVSGAGCWGCPPPFTQSQNHVSLQAMQWQRHPDQSTQLHLQLPGWPDLSLHYNAAGQLTQWQNSYQQPVTLHYEGQRAHRINWANNTQHTVHYNSQGQVQTIDYQHAQQTLQTRLSRPHPRHLVIDHPTEQEYLRFNETGQLLSRKIQRHLLPPSSSTPINWHYEERFDYDDQQRLVQHHLPEGGVLQYIWGPKQIERIEWINRQQHTQWVVRKIPLGYEYANLSRRLEVQHGPHHFIYVGTTQTAWWQQLQRQEKGLVTARHQSYDLLPSQPRWHHHYAYNTSRQLVIEKTNAPSPRFYAWRQSGLLAASSSASTPLIQRDAAGWATRWQQDEKNYILGYNALGRLHTVHNPVETVQKNSHNAAGFRIYTQHYPQDQQQFFLYHNKKLVAEYTTHLETKLPTDAVHPISRRYIYLDNQPIAMIDYDAHPDGELLLMHSDHLGAVHIISDLEQNLRWAATYDAFGYATQQAGDLDFHLRREGQYHDMSTNWHDNLLRTYLPQQGHFLEPDPIGPTPFSQLYGYSQQQPLNHTDPWGLLLFAFDGTRYDHTVNSVVHQLHQASQETSYYVAGPGNPETLDWDALIAHSAGRIVRKQWDALIRHLIYLQHNAPHTVVPIDIIGFSRGSALALHFANQVLKYTKNGLFSYTNRYGDHVQMCIQPRFIGLLDTVTQMGILGSHNFLFNFSVSPLWQWVGHAVALHEYRYLFPLHALGTGDNIIEIGLIGAHGDLGGGYPEPTEADTRPLSDIALEWLLWQARAQGLAFDPIPLNSDAKWAYLHDESLLIEFDRDVENYDSLFFVHPSLRNKQFLHPTYGYGARRQVRAFLDRSLSKEEKIHNRVAKVDLEAYYEWLKPYFSTEP